LQTLSAINASRILVESNSSNSIGGSVNNNFAVGLKNLGNTCFLNSVLQALASIRTFHAYLISQPRLKDMQLVQALKETIAVLSLKNRTIEPPVVKVPSVRKRFITMEQQDAHELMQFVISALTEETEQVPQVPSLSLFKDSNYDLVSPLICTSTSSFSPLALSFNAMDQDLSSSIRIPEVKLSSEKFPSIAKKFLSRNPFVGILQSTLKCSRCGSQFPPTYQKFVDISLSIPEHFLRYNKPQVCTLEDCLKLFSASELVQEVDCLTCSKRKANKLSPLELLALPYPISEKTTALKKLSIARPPKTLCLHIRRLIGLGGPVVKLNCHIDFPLELDIAPFCSFNGEVAFESSLVKSIFRVETQERKDSNRCSSMRLANESTYSTSPVNGSIVGGNPSKHDERYTCECASKKNRVTKGQNGVETSSLLYRLVSVIVHHGNHSGGHYTVFRKLLSDPFSNLQQYDEFINKSMYDPNYQQADKREWVHISDEHTQRVSVDEVLKSQAYMLYYEKVD